MNNELERIWKEWFVDELEVLSGHLFAGTEENVKKRKHLRHDRRCLGRDPNPGHPE
jgi:hypothetical protein